MASESLQKLLQFEGGAARYYMPLLKTGMTGAGFLDYIKKSRESVDEKALDGPTPELTDDPFYSQFQGVASWLSQLPPGNAIINGDYDVDGCTSTVIAWKMLRLMGWSVRLFTPDRIEDHYGVNAGVLEEQIGREKVDLIMTVDCGSAHLRELDDMGRRHGAKTLVIDHHARLNPPENVTTVEVNPHKHPEILSRLDTDNPHCAAVLTYMLASQIAVLRPEVTRVLPEMRILAGLAAIADIADMATPGTRHCARHFLQEACEPGTNKGLGMLLQKLGVTTEQLDTSKAAFTVIPVLNAANRMANANMVINLLAYQDPKELGKICDELIVLNKTRRVAQRKVEDAAQAKLMGKTRCVLEFSPDWGIGLLGPAAGQIAYRNQVVAILGGVNPKSGEIVFSGRTPRGSEVDALQLFKNAVEALPPTEQKKFTFGGHAPAFGARLTDTASVGLLDKIRTHMGKALDQGEGIKLTGQIIDCSIGTKRVSRETLEAIKPMEPFGLGNPEPRFLVPNVRLSLRPKNNDPNVLYGSAIDKDQATIKIMAFASPNVMAGNHSRVNLVGRLMPDYRALPGESGAILKVEDVVPIEDPREAVRPSVGGR
jgi:single-stranded-DNA-specific exonuclease